MCWILCKTRIHVKIWKQWIFLWTYSVTSILTTSSNLTSILTTSSSVTSILTTGSVTIICKFDYFVETKRERLSLINLNASLNRYNSRLNTYHIIRGTIIIVTSILSELTIILNIDSVITTSIVYILNSDIKFDCFVKTKRLRLSHLNASLSKYHLRLNTCLIIRGTIVGIVTSILRTSIHINSLKCIKSFGMIKEIDIYIYIYYALFSKTELI